MNNTQDLSKFGYRELRMVAELLTAYCDDPNILGDNVTVEFNPNSGCVFLVDEDYNTAMMNGDQLEEWFTCPYCGYEGFLDDMSDHAKDTGLNPECIEYLTDIGVIDKEE